MAKSKSNSKNTKGGKGASGSKKNQKQQKSNKQQPMVKVTRNERISKQPTRKAPSHFDVSKEGKEFRHVVRISGRDVPGFMNLGDGLCFVYGLGIRISKIIENVFAKKANKIISKVGYLTDEDVEVIEKIINNLDSEIPTWLLNRAKTISGNEKHLIMADLRLENRKDIQNLGKTKSYRGLRLQWGLTVRGQKTKSSFRRSGAVGVSKKK